MVRSEPQARFGSRHWYPQPHRLVGPAIEKAELPAGGVMDRKSVWEFGDPPRPGKTAGHVEIPRGRKPRRTDDHAEVDRVVSHRDCGAGWLLQGARGTAIGHRSHDSISGPLAGSHKSPTRQSYIDSPAGTEQPDAP